MQCLKQIKSVPSPETLRGLSVLKKVETLMMAIRRIASDPTHEVTCGGFIDLGEKPVFLHSDRLAEGPFPIGQVLDRLLIVKQCSQECAYHKAIHEGVFAGGK